MSWWAKKNVVAPVDFSDASFTAVDAALELVADPAHVCVLHVLQELPVYEFGERYGTVSHESRDRHVRRALRQRLSDAKYHGIRVEVVFDEPARGIVGFANRSGAELIVMSSYERSGLRRFFAGSTAERVVRLAHCPVLVLHGDTYPRRQSFKRAS